MDRISAVLPSRGELLANCAYTAALQPVNVVKVLIQVGYEPLPPRYVKPGMFFFSGGYFYPNIYRYMQYLAEREGTKLVLYRGLTPRLASVFVYNTVRTEVLAACPPSKSRCPPEQIAYEVGRQCGATLMSVILSHPFLVVTNRMIVSLVGGEQKYTSVSGAVATIFREEGIWGFYAGVVPHLLGEVSGKAIEILAKELIDRLEVNKKLGLPAPAHGSGTVLPVSALHSFISYPLQLTTTIMSVNNCGMAVSDLPPIQNTQTGWIDCIKALWNSGNIKRGSNLMFARKAASQTWHTPQQVEPIAPSSRISNLSDGEVVELTPDVATITEVTPEVIPEVTPEVIPEVTPEVTPPPAPSDDKVECVDGSCKLKSE